MRLARPFLLALLLAMLFAGSHAGSAQARSHVCVYTEDRNVIPGKPGSLTGHGFVQLLPDSGPDAGRRDLLYGFHPQITALFFHGGPGKVVSEVDHRWTWKICYPVSPTDYDLASELVAEDIADPPWYIFLPFNCTDWAYKVARRAYLRLPDISFLGIRDPAKLATKLEEIFKRGQTFNGGKVFFNAANVAPQLSEGPSLAGLPLHRGRASANAGAEFEGTESPQAIINFALKDPKAAGRGLDLSARDDTLRKAEVGVGRPLRLSLAGIGSRGALAKVDFGDGPDQFERERFKHRYRHPGRYLVRGVAIAREIVYRFDFTVQVDRGHLDEAVKVKVPHGHLRPDDLPHLAEPVTPALIPTS